MSLPPGDLMPGSTPSLPSDPNISQVGFKSNRWRGRYFPSALGGSLSSNASQGVGFCEAPTVEPSLHTGGPHVPIESTGMTDSADGSQTFLYGEKTLLDNLWLSCFQQGVKCICTVILFITILES